MTLFLNCFLFNFILENLVKTEVYKADVPHSAKKHCENGIPMVYTIHILYNVESVEKNVATTLWPRIMG